MRTVSARACDFLEISRSDITPIIYYTGGFFTTEKEGNCNGLLRVFTFNKK
jgi:hypothetical protein